MASQGTSVPPDAGIPGPGVSAFNTISSETNLSDVLITLRKRRWIVIVALLIGLFFAIRLIVNRPKMYIATGRIQVRTGSSNEYRVSTIYNFGGADAQTRLQSEVNILQSDSLLLTVARDLNLPNDPNFFGGGGKGGPTHYSLDDPDVRQATVGTLQSHLKVALVLKTDLIGISYSSLNAKLSADIVNKLIAEYIQRSYETRYASTQRVSQWLSGQLDDLKQQVETSEEQMMDVQKRLGIFGLDPQHSQIVTGIDDLTRAANEARIARIMAEARYRTLSGMGTDAVTPDAQGSLSSVIGSGPSTSSFTSGSASAPPAESGSSSMGYESSQDYGTSSVNPGGSTSSTSSSYGGSSGYGRSAPSSGTRTSTPMVTNNGPVETLRNQLASLEATYAQTQATLGPKHPTVKAMQAQMAELRRQIGIEQKRMVTASHEAYVIARNTEDQTTATLNTEKDNAYKLRDDMVEYTLREREYESNRNLYDALRQRLRTAGIQAGLESLEVDVVDQAVPPTYPTMQAKSTILIVALLISGMIGVGLAFLMESLDTGLRSIAEIEAITELPSLAIIPRARRSGAEAGASLSAAERNLTVLTQPKSQFAEAIRSLRTSLLLSRAGHPPRLIVFTSSTPSEGKTTAVANLACVLAQGEARVLLIDADLRRPNVHHRFGLNGKVGVTTVLTGTTRLEDAVQHIPEVPNLSILSSGPIPPFPTEMLASQAMNDLLEQAAKEYDHILIDTPPVLSVTDGVLLARKADAVAFIVRHGKSSKHVVRRARDLLIRAGAPVTGIVLNAVDLNAPEYYGYYGYSGYSYSSIDAESWETKSTSGKDRRS